MNYRSGRIPLLMKEGGRAIKKKDPFRNGTTGVVGHRSMFRNAFLNMVCERPPRLRLLRWLRSILLMAQPPLLRKEGNTFGEFIHSFKEHDYDNSSFAFIRS